MSIADQTPSTERIRMFYGSAVSWTLEERDDLVATRERQYAEFDRWLAAHDAETEAAVRARIAADIGELEHDRAAAKDSAWLYSVDWVEGHDHAVALAARIARGGA